MCQSWNTFNVIYRGAYFAPLIFFALLINHIIEIQ